MRNEVGFGTVYVLGLISSAVRHHRRRWRHHWVNKIASSNDASNK